MSTRSAIIWFVLAMALAALAALVGRRPDPGLSEAGLTARLSESDLTPVSVIEVRLPNAEVLTVRRAPDADLWLLERAGHPSWPVEAGRVRSILRVISMTGGERTPGTQRSENAPPSASATGVTTLSLHAGGEPILTLELDAGRLQGRALASATDASGRRTLRIDDGLHRSITLSNLLSWRERRVLPRLPSELSRIQLTLPDGPIELARLSGRWGLRAPITTTAEPRAVDALIRTLQLMESARFLDAHDAPFPETPRIRVVAEVDRRDPVGDARTIERWTIELGGTGPQGGTFLARLWSDTVQTRTGAITPRWGPVIAELQADRLSEIPAAVEPYIARQHVQVPEADIGSIAMVMGSADDAPRVIYARDLSGWTVRTVTGESESNQTPARATEADQRAISALLRTLATSEPEKLTVLASEGALPGGLPIELMDLGGRPVQNARLFIESTAQTPLLIVTAGRVARTYRISPELAAWFTSR